MSKLSREEFESILEECFIEGYNSALEDIEEDILDEEAFDLEGDYDSIIQEMDKYDKQRFKDTMHNLKLDDPNTGLSKKGLMVQARDYIANFAPSARRFSKEYKEKQYQKSKEHFHNYADNKDDIHALQKAHAAYLVGKHVLNKK